jgi:hypothetical protein
LDGRGLEQVGVVEHEHERRLAALGADGVDGARDRAEQPSRIVVALVECEPCERARVALGPLAQQRRLAVAGRSDDQRQRRRVGVAQQAHQARAANERAAGRWGSQRDRGHLGAASIAGAGIHKGRTPADRGAAGTHVIPFTTHPHQTMRVRRRSVSVL